MDSTSQQIMRAEPDGEWMRAAPARFAANSSDVTMNDRVAGIVGQVAAEEMHGCGLFILIQVEEDDEQR